MRDGQTDGRIGEPVAGVDSHGINIPTPTSNFILNDMPQRETRIRVYTYTYLYLHIQTRSYTYVYMYTRWIRNRAADGGYWGAFVLVSP